MSALTIVYISVLAVSAVASGFFSGSETALIGIGRERVHQLATEGHRGERVAGLVAEPERLLSTLLVANNLVNILGAAVATTLFISLLGETLGPWVATVAVTAVVLVVGEITPKTLAARYPERFSLAVAPTIWHLSRVLGPVARFFGSITRGLLRLIRVRVEGATAGVTQADIRALAALGHAGGDIALAEREIIDALFGLAERPVRDVMTPRLEMVALTLPVRVEDVRLAVAATGHSRFPVTTGDADDLRGVLYVKDVFRQQSAIAPSEVERLLRRPYFLPESMSVLASFQQMRAERLTFAVVLDEHGGVEGIVTDKDLIAELVGEFQDEYDPGSPTVVRMGPRQWLSDGRVPLEDLEEALGATFPEGPYSTAGGLYLALAGKIPVEGESVRTDGVQLTVLSMDRNRIDRLRVEAGGDTGRPDGGAG